MTTPPPSRKPLPDTGIGLRLWLGLSYVALTVLLAVVMALLVDVRASRQLRAEIGERLAAHARHLAADLARETDGQPDALPAAMLSADLLAPLATHAERMEVLLVDAAGNVLAGPDGHAAIALPARSLAALAAAGSGHLDDAWHDDGRYLVGFARADAGPGQAAPAWRVLVRTPYSAAMSGLVGFRLDIARVALGLILLAAIAGIAMARRIGAPLHALAEAATRIRAGATGARLPHVGDYREARQLAQSLAGLLDDVATRERELRELADNLEARVENRTRELSLANAELERLAVTDALTGLSNRRRFDEQFALETDRALRQRRPLTLMLLDIDHFKQINDQFGHPVGDHTLCTVAQLLDQAIRPSDAIARVGGEEFAVLATDIAPEHVGDLAERLRQRVASFSPIDVGRLQVPVSVSIGVATLMPGQRPAGSTEEVARWLYAQADMALYRAKHEGRDRVVFASE